MIPSVTGFARRSVRAVRHRRLALLVGPGDWSLALVSCSGLHEVNIDANSGAVLENKIETPADEAKEKAADRAAKPAPKPRPRPRYPQLLPAARGTGPISFAPAVRWQGQTAAWITRMSSGASIMTFDQRLLELHLHSGTVDAGTLGWRYGPSVGGFERTRLAAAFNGGFRLSVGAGGFESYRRFGVPLQSGLGSIVTYSEGSTDIGSWHQEVPAPGKRVVSVRQNLSLLIDHGVAASNVECVSCWGATLGGVATTSPC